MGVLRCYAIIWAVILVIIIIRTFLTKKFSILSLLFIAGTSMFWIEWRPTGVPTRLQPEFAMIRADLHWYQTYWKPIP